jgi:hypothetical protein
MATPLIQVDVDGVLIPTYATRKPRDYRVFHVSRAEAGVSVGTGQRIWLNPKHGPWLRALKCDMNWATSWEGAANREIGARLGLPEMSHVTFPVKYIKNADGSHWKLDELMMNADGRPFVWIDDGITGADTVRLAREYPAPALAYRVDPRWGLTVDDMANIWQWLDFIKS